MLFAQRRGYAIDRAAECDPSYARCEPIGGLMGGQPGVEIGGVNCRATARPSSIVVFNCRGTPVLPMAARTVLISR